MALERLATALGNAATIEDVFQASLDALRDALEVQRSSVLLFDADSVMRFVASHGLSDEYRRQVDGHSPWTPESDSPDAIVVGDAEHDDSLGPYRDVILREGIRALGFFPLVVSGRVIGKFMLYYDAPHVFSEAELRTGKLLAATIAFGVSRFRAESDAARKAAEAAEALRQLQVVTDNLPVFISYMDRNGRYRFINQAYEKWFARKREEILGKTVYELLGEANAALVKARVDRALSGEFVRDEAPIVDPAGTAHWMRATYVPDAREGGVEGIFALIEDVTRERASHQALQASEERYRAFIARTHEAIWRVELDHPMSIDLPEDDQVRYFFRHASVVECNESMVRMCGYEHAAELEGTRLRDLMPEENAANVDYVRGFIRGGYQLEGAELVEHDRRGRARYFIDNLTGIVKEGHLLRAWGTRRDLTSERERQQRIVESEEQFRLVANTVPAIIWRSDRDGVCTFLNHAWSEASGRRIEEGLGSGWINQFHPDDRERTDIESRSAIARRAPFSIEYRLLHASGEYRWMLDNGIPQWAADGSFDGYIGISVDIHDRKAAEQERQRLMAVISANERKLEETIRTVPGVVWELEGTPGSQQHVSFVSEHIETLLGYSVQQWHQEQDFWLKVIHPDDRAVLEERTLRRFVSGADGVERVRMIRKDGRVIWTEIRTRVIQDEKGNPIGLRGLTLDVTATVREEERTRFLARAAAALSGTSDYEVGLASLADVVVKEFGEWCLVDILDDQGTPRRLAIAARGGVPPEIAAKLRNDHPPQRAGGEVAAVLATGTGRLKSKMSEEDFEQLSRVPGLRELARHIGLESYMILPMRSGSRTIGALTIISSTAERIYDDRDFATGIEFADRASLFLENARLYREAQNANRLKDEFLATLSHELRTPMTATLGWAALIRGGNLPPETLQIGIESIEQATRSQAKLVDDILDVSRIVTGKMTMTLAPTNLWQVVELATDTVRGGANAKGVGIELSLQAEQPIVAGDASRLQQIVWNLLSNAVKFTPQGGRVSIRLVENRRNELRLVVADTGEGIAPEFLPHIFERFRQADSTPSRRYGGLGLGLAIARNLAELHGGALSAESPGEGRGATFSLTIPRIDEKFEFVDRRVESAPMLRGIAALVVDDDAPTRGMLQAALSGYQADVEVAASAAEAMLKLRSRRFDVVVSDIGMPEEDGFAFLSQIRGEKALDRVEVIALTAYARPDDREKVLAAGFCSYLTKPVEPSALAREVASIFLTARG